MRVAALHHEQIAFERIDQPFGQLFTAVTPGRGAAWHADHQRLRPRLTHIARQQLLGHAAFDLHLLCADLVQLGEPAHLRLGAHALRVGAGVLGRRLGVIEVHRNIRQRARQRLGRTDRELIEIPIGLTCVLGLDGCNDAPLGVDLAGLHEQHRTGGRLDQAQFAVHERTVCLLERQGRHDEQIGLVPQRLADDALVDRVIPTHAGAHRHPLVTQNVRQALEAAPALLDPRGDEIRRAAAHRLRLGGLRLVEAVEQIDLRLEGAGQPSDPIQHVDRHELQARHCKHQPTPDHPPSPLSILRCEHFTLAPPHEAARSAAA